MHVQAINNISLAPRFEGRAKKTNKETHNYPQMDAPVSKKAADAFRNGAMAVIIPAAALGMTSCDKDDWLVSAKSSSSASTSSWAWAKADPVIIKVPVIIRDTVNNEIIKHDTTYVTKIEPMIINNYPEVVNDSLVHQIINLGGEVEGPQPSPDKDVLVAGVSFYNEYDHKLYVSKLDKDNTTKHQLSYITKVEDTYDGLKTSYRKVIVTNVPGEGIKFTRFQIPADKFVAVDSDGFPSSDDRNWEYLEYEIIQNGNVITKNNEGVVTSRKYTGRNIGHRYDRQASNLPNGRMIEYLKGMQPGEFLVGQYVYDEFGNPCYQDGEPEKAQYDHNQLKAYTVKLNRIDENQYTDD